MKKFLFLLLVVTAVGHPSTAQTADEKAVAAAVDNLRKAMLDGDRAMLEKLAASNLSYGHSGGKVEDKASFVEAIASGKSDFLTIELSDQTIMVTGNTAVVRHVINGTNNDGGKPGIIKIAVLLVWTKQSREWKLLARQAVKI